MQFNIASEKAEKGLEPFVLEFLTDRESEYKQLQSCLEDNDFEGIRSMAHKWKGFCGPYGFDGLGSLSATLETKSQEKNLESCQQLVGDIQEYLKVKRAQVVK